MCSSYRQFAAHINAVLFRIDSDTVSLKLGPNDTLGGPLESRELDEFSAQRQSFVQESIHPRRCEELVGQFTYLGFDYRNMLPGSEQKLCLESDANVRAAECRQ